MQTITKKLIYSQYTLPAVNLMCSLLNSILKQLWLGYFMPMDGIILAATSAAKKWMTLANVANVLMKQNQYLYI